MDEMNVAFDTTQYIVIKIGEEQYGIDIQHIDNIVRMQSMTRVPKVPAHLKGVINLRGEVIPVMSLRLKMGLEDDEITKSSRIIILKMDQQEAIGIIVDQVKEVVTLNNEQIERMSYDKEDRKPYVFAVGKQIREQDGEQDGELISLLDLVAVLAE